MISPEELAEWKRVAGKATPRPWIADAHHHLHGAPTVCANGKVEGGVYVLVEENCVGKKAFRGRR